VTGRVWQDAARRVGLEGAGVRVIVAGAGFAGLQMPFAAPLGRVHFAGEHTAGAWAGLMEGALRSGARAASEVLTHARPFRRAAVSECSGP
jgi:monoamine oxidase